jgi:Na+/proline symporter
VQRYLTGRSITQSRLGLLLNGLAKVPMQFFILFIGVVIFAFFQFVEPPLFFNPVEAEKVKSGVDSASYRQLEETQARLFHEKLDGIHHYLDARRHGNNIQIAEKKEQLLSLQQQFDDVHTRAAGLAEKSLPSSEHNDANYIFLIFVLSYLPLGLVGLVFACVFTASMSSSSGELSALATTTVIDIYRRFIKPGGSEQHYVHVSRMMMVFWGCYGIAFAQYASRLGSLIEAVNILGSLFYGTMLGIFLLAFYFRTVSGTAAFYGGLIGEISVLFCFEWTSIAWLWYNVIGCIVVITAGLTLTRIMQHTSLKNQLSA